MSQPQRTLSTDANDAIRKRVCKACDRCRLKKSKCDGSTPCSRCKVDNAICVFGERKKSHDKVYPKGYVEMLEQQQGQLVSGLQIMYQRLRDEHAWDGPELSLATGHPLTHDILAALHLLEPKHDGSGEMEKFEENTDMLQSRMLASGAGYMQRRGSFSSDSDHSQHSGSRRGPPSISTIQKASFNLSASPSPLAQSPVPRQRLSYPTPQQSPLYQSFPSVTTDASLYQSEWSFPDSSAAIQAKYASQVSQLQQQLEDVDNIIDTDQWGGPSPTYGLCAATANSYTHTLPSAFNSMHTMQDYSGGIDPMELEFSNFLQPAY